MPTIERVISELEALTPDERLKVRRWLDLKIAFDAAEEQRRKKEAERHREKRIEALRTSGASIRQIAAAVGRSRSSVHRYLQAWRVTTGVKQGWVPAPLRDEP